MLPDECDTGRISIRGANEMGDQDNDSKNVHIETLEHSDTKESFRQLLWTIGVTVVGLALIAWAYL
jgi:hypothetical protein